MSEGPELKLRPMTRQELDTVMGWAGDVGWNPGLNDAGLFWEADPDGFVAADIAGEMVGSASIVSYEGGRFGYLGLFIVPEEHRGRGIGKFIWDNRDVLCERLIPDAPRGLDGVAAMESMYAAGGYLKSHGMLRMSGTAQRFPESGNTRPIDEESLADVLALDRECFGYDRSDFMRLWVEQPGAISLIALDPEDRFRGFAVARPCLSGYKLAPLFAADASSAFDLAHDLSSAVAGSEISVDVPENNASAITMAAELGLSQSMGCAQMYQGDPPDLPWDKVFAITSSELG